MMSQHDKFRAKDRFTKPSEYTREDICKFGKMTLDDNAELIARIPKYGHKIYIVMVDDKTSGIEVMPFVWRDEAIKEAWRRIRLAAVHYHCQPVNKMIRALRKTGNIFYKTVAFTCIVRVDAKELK